jgi:hypothetical protein
MPKSGMNTTTWMPQRNAASHECPYCCTHPSEPKQQRDYEPEAMTHFASTLTLTLSRIRGHGDFENLPAIPVFKRCEVVVRNLALPEGHGRYTREV